METPCRQENCTVAETGICLLNNDPATCVERFGNDSEQNLDALLTAEPPLAPPPRKPQFEANGALSPVQLRDLMAQRYCRLIGILGAPDAGKTASLVSLYLLLSKGKLVGFEYADSDSLMALDEISRGARRWNEGALPQQMTVHTELTDDREPGFLHLQLVCANQCPPIDLLLPDLPGEWSVSLAESTRTDRWNFLHRADVIWLMVDGEQLSQNKTRLLALHKLGLLLGRLSDLLSPLPSIFLVVTRKDKGKPSPDTLTAIAREAALKSITLTVFEIASFADDGIVEPGEGIAELLAASVASHATRPPFWPEHERVNTGRSFDIYRSENR